MRDDFSKKSRRERYAVRDNVSSVNSINATTSRSVAKHQMRGNYARAIAMRERCVAICQEEWNITEGEAVDQHRREIQRLRERMAREQ